MSTSEARKMRVLVVDDNEASLKTTGWTMEMFGHEVRTEKEGRAAIKTAGDFRPEVVLLDLSLPGMDGYEICRNLRSNPALAGTIFVAQTGWDGNEHRTKSAQAGFHHHLIKPVDLMQLDELLKESILCN